MRIAILLSIAVGIAASAHAQPASARNGAYANCDAARAAGKAPVRRGEPGYGPHLDRDNDGVGCEQPSRSDLVTTQRFSAPTGAFRNCSAARAAGAAPVRCGEPGYGPHLDRDNDGVGCE